MGYELDMISALIALGRTADADPLMDEVLQRKPNDGAVNLAAARLKVKEGDQEAAVSYYHRAIYGEWTKDPAARKRDARFELVDFLLKEHSKQELLAELITLEAESDGDEQSAASGRAFPRGRCAEPCGCRVQGADYPKSR